MKKMSRHVLGRSISLMGIKCLYYCIVLKYNKTYFRFSFSFFYEFSHF